MSAEDLLGSATADDVFDAIVDSEDTGASHAVLDQVISKLNLVACGSCLPHRLCFFPCIWCT